MGKAKYIIIRMIIVVTLCILSIPIWFNKNNSLSGALAMSFDNEIVSISIDQFKPLIVIDDNEALSIIEPTKVLIKNHSDRTESINLVFLVTKTSTIDYHYIRVSLDDKIYNLNSLNRYEDADNYYFVLENINIEAQSNIEYGTRIWVNTSAGKLPNTSSLTTNFLIK